MVLGCCADGLVEPTCQTRWLACAGQGAGLAGGWTTGTLPWPVASGMASPGLAMGQLVSRAAWPGFDGWWSKVAGCGFFAPARSIWSGWTGRAGKKHTVLARSARTAGPVCAHRARICMPPTHGIVGPPGCVVGAMGMPESIASHPAVFVTSLDRPVVRRGAWDAGGRFRWRAALPPARPDGIR